MPLLILLPANAYVYIGWGVLAALSVGAWLLCRRRKNRRLWWLLAVPLALLWYVFLYGVYIGFGKIEVRRITFASADLPPAFDGYRIVQFSDAHVGTYTGWREDILRRAIDSINAQNADLIVFTGDLQNKTPDEIEAHAAMLSRLQARDGVFAVLGNHDYAEYVKADEATKAANCQRTQEQIRALGWTLLNNERRVLYRGADSIVIAGMENDGEGRFPQLGNISQAVGNSRAFTVMLEHDPSSWRRKILPHSHVQLTLSGHTHAMQLALFGWSPMQLLGKECNGLYEAEHGRALYVSKGLGGVIPFRFGATGELVVITLKRK